MKYSRPYRRLMGSAAEAVRRRIEDDVFLQEALARGIVKYRAMARWLKNNRLGDAHDVSTIAQAIQRNKPEEGNEAMAMAWSSLQASRVDHHSGLATLTLRLTQAAGKQLPTALGRAEPARGESVRIHHDDAQMTLVLDEDMIPQVEDSFGDDVLGTETGLAELRIVPEEGADLHPAVASLVVAGLCVNGYEPELTIADSSTLTVIVDQADSRDGFDLLQRYTDNAV